MLYTYLNDNQGMPYPFYGHGSLPFPMSVITGISLCIRSEDAAVNPVYASSIVITENTVRLAICKKSAEGEAVLLGIFYANTDGYYTYIPTMYAGDAVYENQTFGDDVLRYVYADFAPITEQTTEGIATTYMTYMNDVIEHIQVFYSYVRGNLHTILGRSASYGHIQLGTIPKEAVGSYIGEFYLDPSCVLYIPNDVSGHHTAYTINTVTQPVRQTFTIGCTGLLTVSVDAGTARISTVYDADDAELVKLDFETRNRVEFINGTTISSSEPPNEELTDLEKDKYIHPRLNIQNLDTLATWRVAHVTDTAITLEIDGNTSFPNCY